MVRKSRQRARGPPRRSGHVAKNLRTWDTTAAAYEQRHAADLNVVWKAWGLFRIPETNLRLLGDVHGLRVLDFGCGAARWAIALAREGASVVGFDLSLHRLSQARRMLSGHPVPVRLVRGDAERPPFTNGSFDLVLSDWGAMTFCDPRRTIPQVARLLAEDGVLVFATSTPIRFLCEDEAADRLHRRLVRPYFGLHHLEFPETTDFQLSYGEWISLFGANGLRVERLIEPRPEEGSRSSYLTSRELAWGREWPLEHLWKVRKVADGPSSSGPTATEGETIGTPTSALRKDGDW